MRANKEFSTLEDYKKAYSDASIPEKSKKKYAREFDKFNMFCLEHYGEEKLTREAIKCYVVHCIYKTKSSQSSIISYISIIKAYCNKSKISFPHTFWQELNRFVNSYTKGEKKKKLQSLKKKML